MVVTSEESSAWEILMTILWKNADNRKRNFVRRTYLPLVPLGQPFIFKHQHGCGSVRDAVFQRVGARLLYYTPTTIKSTITTRVVVGLQYSLSNHIPCCLQRKLTNTNQECIQMTITSQTYRERVAESPTMTSATTSATPARG